MINSKPRVTTIVIMIYYTICFIISFILLNANFKFVFCSSKFIAILVLYVSLMFFGNFFNCIFSIVVGIKVNNKSLLNRREDNIFEEYTLNKITLEIRSMWVLIFMISACFLYMITFFLLCSIDLNMEPKFFFVSFIYYIANLRILERCYILYI